MPTIGIIGGKGQMGSVMARFLREQGFWVIISDCGTSLTNVALAKESDVVVVSVPMDKTVQVIKSIVPHVKRTSLFMDMTSIKEKPVEAMLQSKASVIGLHPLCNGSTFGPGQTLVYCPARPGKWGSWFKEVFKKKGGFELIKATAKEHDAQMATAQVLIHFTEIALGKTLANLNPSLKQLMAFASPSSRLQLQLTARHLAQDPNLYGNIQIQNAQSGMVLKTYAEAVNELSHFLRANDLKKFTSYFQQGKRWFGGFGKESMATTDHLIAEMTSIPKAPFKEERWPKNSIATLGPVFSHSALAAEEWAKKTSQQVICLPTIQSVVEAVVNKKVAGGILPVENRLSGTVRETLDALFQKKAVVTAAWVKPIHHVLAMLPPGNPQFLTTILSHEQALNQSRRFLKMHYAGARWKTVESTTAAFEDVLRRKDFKTAVVGSVEAARHFGFKILHQNIENDPNNETCFWLITSDSAQRSPLKTSLKTSIIFYFAKNKPGSLFSVFKIFADLGINLSRIESRPTGKKFGEYLFYLDFDADATRGPGKLAMEKLKKVATKVQWLGTY